MELLKDLARHQIWADEQHWKALNANPAVLGESEVQVRLNHMLMACRMLTTLARGEAMDPVAMNEMVPVERLEAAMVEANRALLSAVETVDVTQPVHLPRGPNGPFEAPAGVVLVQALTHSQHHRGQNASRMRALGVAPPMTDFIYWFAMGKP